MIEEGLVTELGALAATYPGHLPQGTARPAITYTRSSTARFQHHDGPSTLVTARMALVCHGDTHAAAMALARSVVASLDGYSGTLGDVTVFNTQIETEADLGWDADSEAWLVLVEAAVHYREE